MGLRSIVKQLDFFGKSYPLPIFSEGQRVMVCDADYNHEDNNGKTGEIIGYQMLNGHYVVRIDEWFVEEDEIEYYLGRELCAE